MKIERHAALRCCPPETRNSNGASEQSYEQMFMFHLLKNHSQYK